MISFATDISAVFQAEFVFMQGTNQVSQRIQVAIGQYGSGMRAFLSAGKKLVIVFGKADCFAIYFNFGKAVGIEIKFGNVSGYFMPGWACCHLFIFNSLREFFVCHRDTESQKCDLFFFVY